MRNNNTLIGGYVRNLIKSPNKILFKIYVMNVLLKIHVSTPQYNNNIRVNQ